VSRQSQRHELERTWVVYEPLARGTPLTKRAMEEAELTEEQPAPAPDVLPSDSLHWGTLARLAR